MRGSELRSARVGSRRGRRHVSEAAHYVHVLVGEVQRIDYPIVLPSVAQCNDRCPLTGQDRCIRARSRSRSATYEYLSTKKCAEVCDPQNESKMSEMKVASVLLLVSKRIGLVTVAVTSARVPPTRVASSKSPLLRRVHPHAALLEL